MTNKMYVADTENNVPRTTMYEDVTPEEIDNTPRTLDLSDLDKMEVSSETRVWAAALCPALENPTASDVVIDNSIEGFITRARKLSSGSTVYFHNLAYDGPLLVTALLRMGYTLHQPKDNRKRKPPAGTFTAMITDEGVWYSLTVTFHHGNRAITFSDSMKILPFSVDVIGKSLKTKATKLVGGIDYQKHRPVGYVPTPSEVRYIQNDVLVMSEAIAKLHGRQTDLTESLTIGAACMKEYKKTLGGGDLTRGNQVYDHIFSELSDEDDEKLRKSYRGGWCYVNRQNPLIDENQAIDLTQSSVKGNTYDVNSLYPSAMKGRQFPVGQPVSIDPMAFDSSATYPYIVRLSVDFSVKANHVPFIQLKGSSIFAENEYVRDTDGAVEITLTKPDYLMFLDHYDIHEEEVLDVWAFQSATGLFDAYIDSWFEVKANATNPVDRMIAKLMLNNLYGKMAQSMVRNSGVPYLDDAGVLRLDAKSGSARGGYIPIGSFITAYARETTVRAAQANYDRFLYADTDSMHLIGEAVGVPVGDGLGEWDHEDTWDMARFVRQKTYIERIITDGTPHLSVKAAGATPAVKDRLLHRVTEFDGATWKHISSKYDDNDNCTDPVRPDREVIERFTHGLTEAGKLRRVAAVGGPILVETTFRIHPSDGVVLGDNGLAPTSWSVVE